MVFFKTEDFIFNGLSSEKFQVKMCQITEGDDMICGLSRNIIQSENSINDRKSVLFVENQYVELTCNMVREKHHNVLPLTDEYMFELNRWLWKKKFVPLEFNGLTLNVMVKSITKTQYGKNSKGYLTVTFLAEPYMTSTVYENCKVNGTTNFKLYNKTNVDDYIYIEYVDIELRDGGAVKINNLTNGRKFYLEGLSTNTKNIRIMVDSYRYVYNKEDDDDNVYAKLTNKEWDAFKLGYGINNISIQANNAKVSIVYKEKIALM